MYGDCQVMSSMGGNRVINNNNCSDGLFSSPLHNNPSDFNFMMAANSHHHHLNPFQSFSNIIVPKKEGGLMGVQGKEDHIMDSGGSGSEHIEGGMSGNELDNLDKTQPRKKRYHRHTSHQIQEMESVFKECPHPDDKQRMKLSQDLGLKPRQVKFWFQNRRTQMKAQLDRSDNVILRSDNESLRNENYRLQAALRNIICPNCGGPAMVGELSIDEQQLRIENARLKEELDRVCSITGRYGTRQFNSMGGVPPQQHPSHLLQFSLDLEMGMYNPRQFADTMQGHNNCNEMMPIQGMPENPHFQDSGVIILEEEKQLAVELSISSMDQLMKMCHASEPLWVCNKENCSKEVLNVDEYMKMFPWMMNNNNNSSNPSEFRIEATRESAVVIMNSITLVDAFLDANKWMELFPSIISRAKTIQVLGSGVSEHANGCLQLMHAEFQVLSPLVPTREAYFLRYCQQNVEEGSWVIVDFPTDSFHNSFQPSLPRYKRRPSGCVIQDMPNGYSRVTWVEHAETVEKPVHQIFNHIVNSGMAFGASRWLAILQRQCERLASLMARNISDDGVIPTPEARKNVMNLAQRMIRTFSANMTTSNGQTWTALSDASDDTVRITTRKITEPGQPNGVILTAVSTTWLPYPHYLVFDLLRDERRRSQMEILSNGTSLHEVAHIANGSHPGNCISLLRINVASNSSQNVELMLQESCIDQSGSLIVYSTMDVDSIQLAMNGEDPSCIPILPMGFSIIPLPQPPVTKPAANSNDENNLNPPINPTSDDQRQVGCLLTIGIQVVASSMPTAKLSLSSVSAINNHLCNTLNQVSAALGNICQKNGGSVGNDHDSAAAPNQSTDQGDDQQIKLV